MKDQKNYIQAAIWLIGIGVLALTHHWWPGILVLIGISMVVGALTETKTAPRQGGFPNPPEPPATPQPPARPQVVNPPGLFSAAPAPPADDLSWLPSNCPACGGPLTVTGIKMETPRSAACPFCGTKINKPV